MSAHSPGLHPPDLRRWPADPAQFTDTTLCPACFSRLDSSQCPVCGLDLSAPAAAELLAVGGRIQAEETGRQAVITAMREQQADRAEEAARAWFAAATAAAEAQENAARVTAAFEPPVGPEPRLAPATPDTRSTALTASPTSESAMGGPKARGRSGVQVFLLVLGVALLSVTAIVFLLAAYLIAASLGLRSLIIAGVSVLAFGVAWLLKAERLPGTAEGIGSVAVVLLLLDVWIVRANSLFGTERLDGTAYAGFALLAVSAVLAIIRRLSGLRVAGVASAGLLPVAVFLLGFAVAPHGEPSTGIWLGGLAASIVGSAALLARVRLEQTIVVAGGYLGGVLALPAACFALPELAWHQLWSFSAVTAAWLVAFWAARVRAASPVRVLFAASAVGLAAAIAAALPIFVELDQALAIWLSPAAAGVIVCAVAAVLRGWPRRSNPMLWTLVAAALVAAVSAAPGLLLGIDATGWRAAASLPLWNGATDTADGIAPAVRIVTPLVPVVIALTLALSVAILGMLRAWLAIPAGFLMLAALFAGVALTDVRLAALVIILVAAAGLVLSVALRTTGIPGLVVAFALTGIPAAALAWTLGYAHTTIWPWTTLAVLVLAASGWLFAPRVWPERGAASAGTVHLVTLSVLSALSLGALAPWLSASGVVLSTPWHSPWWWLGAGAGALLGLAALPRSLAPRDRLGFAAPLFLTTLIALVAVAYDVDTAWSALPSGMFVIAGLLWLGDARQQTAVRVTFAALTPLVAVFGATLIAPLLPGDGGVLYAAAGMVLLTAGFAHLVTRRASGAPMVAWTVAVATAGAVTLLSLAWTAGSFVGVTPDQPWLVVAILAPVPLVIAAVWGDPIAGPSLMRQVSWASLGLGVAAVWLRLAGDGVENVEAYTLPLAAALAATAALITWRSAVTGTEGWSSDVSGMADGRSDVSGMADGCSDVHATTVGRTDVNATAVGAADGATAVGRTDVNGMAGARTAVGRTALFAVAAAVAVLPSVGSTGESELRTFILVVGGLIVAITGGYLPESARGVPVRLLVTATGWAAFTGAALVRGSAVAWDARSVLPVEVWPAIALVGGVIVAVEWARTASRPTRLAEAGLAASVSLGVVPTVVAIVHDDAPVLRAAVLFPLLALVHIWNAATNVRPLAGAVFAWTGRTMLVTAGVIVLLAGSVDPFDLITLPAAAGLIGAGCVSMRRSPGLGSWPALGTGLAVLLVPPLIADFSDPVLWRIVALGVASAIAVFAGAIGRLQAPLLLGGSVLLVHAIAQLWPWITWLYQAVWWWLWLGIVGVLLIVLAATYERQLHLARGTIRTIGALQ